MDPDTSPVPEDSTTDVDFEREYAAVGARVAVADIAVQTLDAAIQALRTQRRVASATLTLRLREHSEFLLAHGPEVRARSDARARAALLAADPGAGGQ